MLDGESVVLRPDATSDFFALRSSEGHATAVLVAFDLLVIDNEDLRGEPRRAAGSAYGSS